MNSLVTFEKRTSTSLEASSENVIELVDDNNKQLQVLHLDVQLTTHKIILDDEQETRKKVTSSEIDNCFPMWSNIHGFVKKNYLDNAVVDHVCNLFNDILLYFRQYILRWKKHLSRLPCAA